MMAEAAGTRYYKFRELIIGYIIKLLFSICSCMSLTGVSAEQLSMKAQGLNLYFSSLAFFHKALISSFHKALISPVGFSKIMTR